MKQDDLTWLTTEINSFNVDNGFSDKKKVASLLRAEMDLSEDDLPDDYGDVALWRVADIYLRQIATRRQFTGTAMDYPTAQEFLGSDLIHIGLYVNLLMGVASEVESASILVPPSDLEFGSGELPGVSDVLRDSIDMVVDPVVDVVTGVTDAAGDLIKDVAGGLNMMTPLLIGLGAIACVGLVVFLSKKAPSAPASLPKEVN